MGSEKTENTPILSSEGLNIDRFVAYAKEGLRGLDKGNGGARKGRHDGYIDKTEALNLLEKSGGSDGQARNDFKLALSEMKPISIKDTVESLRKSLETADGNHDRRLNPEELAKVLKGTGVSVSELQDFLNMDETKIRARFDAAFPNHSQKDRLAVSPKELAPISSDNKCRTSELPER